MSKWGGLLLVAVLAGALLRVVDLGRLPGVNGDEAWYGVNVEALRAGERPFFRSAGGNALNPWHSAPLLLLSYVAPPSLALLRVPSAMWGVLTIIVAYPLLRRPLGSQAARWTAMLLALSPALVAYARFGWDPSDTPFFVLLSVGLAIRNQPWLAAVVAALSLTVHPTNVFSLPIVAAAWAPHGLARYARASDQARHYLHIGAIAIAVVGAAVAFPALRRIADDPQTMFPSVRMVIDRVSTPSAWMATVTGVLNVFSGVTTAAFIAGPAAPAIRLVATAIAAIVLLAAILFGWRRRAAPGGSVAPWLMAGIMFSLLVFHVLAGPAMLEPAHERYAMFVLAPLLMLCAVGLDGLAATSRRAASLAMAALCGVFLFVTLGLYFRPLIVEGGASEAAFRTGPAEPKAAAYAFIARDSAGAPVVRVTAQDWWLYWPLRYLASPDSRVHVELLAGATAPRGLRPGGVEPPLYPPPDKDYLVVWSGAGPADAVAVFTAADPIGRPILQVLIRTPR